MEQVEREVVAPYAQFSADTRARRHREPPPEWRTRYQRDRDRVIHSRAFRRLKYKTQVFLNGTGDHLRTRLTHSMEVAAISRNIARALRLNEDLTETIAVAHDLGHSAFGHRGETALNRLLNVHWFANVNELRELAEQWRRTYNTIQRHGSLNKRTPEQFAAHARLRSATPPCVRHELSNSNKEQLVGLTL